MSKSVSQPKSLQGTVDRRPSKHAYRRYVFGIWVKCFLVSRMEGRTTRDSAQIGRAHCINVRISQVTESVHPYLVSRRIRDVADKAGLARLARALLQSQRWRNGDADKAGREPRFGKSELPRRKILRYGPIPSECGMVACQRVKNRTRVRCHERPLCSYQRRSNWQRVQVSERETFQHLGMHKRRHRCCS